MTAWSEASSEGTAWAEASEDPAVWEIYSPWILADGVWNDDAFWCDSDVWEDGSIYTVKAE